MDEISVVGAIIGVVGAIASSVSSTNMFWTRKGEEDAAARASGACGPNEDPAAKADMDRRGWWKDRLALVGTAAMVVGAGWAFAPLVF